MSGETSPPASPAPAARALGWAFAFLTGVTFCLLVLGALVRAHGAGLSCPDWPLCFGQVVPEFDLRVGFEWSHRVLASVVSLGLAGLTLVLLRRPGLRRRLSIPLAGAWLLLGVQVALGALTVLLRLAPWTVVAHLMTGTAFCAVLLWIARDLLEWETPIFRPRPTRAVRALGLASAGLLVVQLLLGGLVSAQSAGLACASFPTCDGHAFVPTLSGLVGLHVLHRLNGFVLLACVIALSVAARGDGRLGPLAWAAARLGVLQIGVGVLNVLLRLPVELTALHTALAAAIALTLLLLLRELAYAGRARVESPGESPGVRPLASSG